MITRRDLIVAALAASVALAALAWAEAHHQPILHSQVFNWVDLKTIPTPQGAMRSVFDGPTPNLAKLECHITTLNPGQSPHPPHRHADEELMVVKEGTLEVLQGDQTHVVSAGGIIFEAANELHGLRNIGTGPATYYVFRFSPHDLRE